MIPINVNKSLVSAEKQCGPVYHAFLIVCQEKHNTACFWPWCADSNTFFSLRCYFFDLSDIDISDSVEAVVASFTVRFSLGVCEMSGLCNQRSAVGLVEAPHTRRVYVLVQWLSFSSLQCSAPLLHTARPLIWPGGWYVFFSLSLHFSPFSLIVFSILLKGHLFLFYFPLRNT